MPKTTEVVLKLTFLHSDKLSPEAVQKLAANFVGGEIIEDEEDIIEGIKSGNTEYGVTIVEKHD